MAKKFGISLYCFLPWVSVLPLPLEFWVGFAKKLGFDGIEYRPVNGWISRQVKRGNFSTKGILGLEVCFRSERSLERAWEHPKRLVALPSYFLLPYIIDSLEDLAIVAQKAGEEIPATLYPDIETWRIKALPIKVKLFQPEAGLLKRAHVVNIPSLIDRMYKWGLDGINWDSRHLTGCLNILSLSWKEAINALEPYIKECQLNISGPELSDIVDRTNATGIWSKVERMASLAGSLILETRPYAVQNPWLFRKIAKNVSGFFKGG